jgi:ABC-type cobalamin/Fe3+-siderophores transport system ATPase subunit
VRCRGLGSFQTASIHGWRKPTAALDARTSVEITELISRRASESSMPAIVNIHTSSRLAATPLAL